MSDGNDARQKQPASGSGLSVLVVVLAASAMLLAELGTGFLLPDECETVMQSLAVLEHGIPKVDRDGSRLIPFVFEWVNENGIWKHTPWIDEYVAAGSIGALGRSRWASRLPFALISIGAIVFYWYLARQILTPDAAWMSLLLYAFSATLIGQGRMCRYYSILQVGGMLFVLGVHQFSLHRYRLGTICLLVAHTVLFYANYIPAILNGTTFALYVLLLGRSNRALWKSLAVYLVGSVLIVLPWAMFVKFELFGKLEKMSYYSAVSVQSGPQFEISKIIATSQSYLSAFDASLFPLLIAIPCFLVIWLRRHSIWDYVVDRSVIIFGIFVCLMAVIMCGFLPIFAERYILCYLVNARLLLAATIAATGKRLRWFFFSLAIAFEIFGNPVRWISSITIDSLVHTSHVATAIRTFMIRRDQPMGDWIEANTEPGIAIDTVGDEMELIYRFGDRRFFCSEWPDRDPQVVPDLVLTESLLGYDVKDQFVELPMGWESFYEPKEVEVSTELIQFRGAESELRSSIVFVRTQPFDWTRIERPKPPAVANSGRGCWLGSESTRLRARVIDGRVGLRVVSERGGSRDILYGAQRLDAFLRGGFQTKVGGKYRVTIEASGEIPGMSVWLEGCDGELPSPSVAATRNDRGWVAELLATQAYNFSRVHMRVPAGNEEFMVYRLALESIGESLTEP